MEGVLRCIFQGRCQSKSNLSSPFCVATMWKIRNVWPCNVDRVNQSRSSSLVGTILKVLHCNDFSPGMLMKGVLCCIFQGQCQSKSSQRSYFHILLPQYCNCLATIIRFSIFLIKNYYFKITLSDSIKVASLNSWHNFPLFKANAQGQCQRKSAQSSPSAVLPQFCKLEMSSHPII